MAGIAETASLVAALSLDTKKFDAGAAKASGSLKKLESTSFKVGQNIGNGMKNAAANIKKIGIVAGTAAVGLLVFAINKASDLNESLSKTNVVFGKAAAGVLAFSKSAAASLGLTQQEALEASASFGNMFNTVGLAQPKAAAMSTTMVKLASDMASFNNEDPNEMLDKLRSGLSGEAEPLRRFGVLLSEAAVKAQAHAMGLDTMVKGGKKVKKTLTEGDKVLARYALILKQTGKQQGDFGRTSDGLANQMRTLRANLTEAATTIGTALLPAVAKMAGRLNKLITDNRPAIEEFAKTLPGAFDKLLEFGEKLPWGAIKSAFEAMGTGGKLLANAFLSMPSWVQTAVLTGWGLNKLTGGALTDIFGTLASGLIKGVLGMNAGVVNINAATVNGVPGTGAPGGSGGVGLLAAATAGGAAAVGSKAIADFTNAEFRGAGFQNVDFEAPGGGPFGVTSLVHNIQQLVGLMNQRPVIKDDRNLDRPRNVGPAADAQRAAIEKVQTEVEAMKGRIADELATVNGTTGDVKTEVAGGSNRVAGAATQAGNTVAGAIRANRPITYVDVNVSATTIEKTVSVITRYGNPGSDRDGGQDSFSPQDGRPR